MIVKDGQIVWMKGYGVRDIDDKKTSRRAYAFHDCQQYQIIYGNVALAHAGSMKKNFHWMIQITKYFSWITGCTIQHYY